METKIIKPAVAWANRAQNVARLKGRVLAQDERRLAAGVGVSGVDDIRIADLGCLPMPDSGPLMDAAQELGLLGPNMVGLALGHAIFVREEQISAQLISLECRHVYQYEQVGSLQAFLEAYLGEILHFGYDHAPMGIDARRYESAPSSR